jgi:hypothetical protein
MRYTSYWRPTANGKTDYLSITIVNNATAQVRASTPEAASSVCSHHSTC